MSVTCINISSKAEKKEAKIEFIVVVVGVFVCVFFKNTVSTLENNNRVVFTIYKKLRAHTLLNNKINIRTVFSFS